MIDYVMEAESRVENPGHSGSRSPWRWSSGASSCTGAGGPDDEPCGTDDAVRSRTKARSGDPCGSRGRDAPSRLRHGRFYRRGTPGIRPGAARRHDDRMEREVPEGPPTSGSATAGSRRSSSLGETSTGRVMDVRGLVRHPGIHRHPFAHGPGPAEEPFRPQQGSGRGHDGGDGSGREFGGARWRRADGATAPAVQGTIRCRVTLQGYRGLRDHPSFGLGGEPRVDGRPRHPAGSGRGKRRPAGNLRRDGRDPAAHDRSPGAGLRRDLDRTGVLPPEVSRARRRSR